MTARIAILASGSGTNAEVLMRACADGELAAEVVAVVTNNADAGVLARAANAGVATRVVDHSGRDDSARAASDERLISVLDELAPDLVVMAGWMRILGGSVGAAHRLINLHPALPGAFAGTRAIERAFDAWKAGSIDRSGVMIHWVPDDGVDVGPVIVSTEIAFSTGESLASFETRLHKVEHVLIVEGTRRALVQLGH